jgi:hypothetical protein
MAKRKAPFYILVAAISALCLYSSKAFSKPSSFIVIANIMAPVESISTSELRDIYNGDRVFWKSGKRIRAARLSDDTPANTDFLSIVVGKSPSQYVQHWRHKLFSGKGLPPKVLEDAEKMMVYIEENESSIGFIPVSKRISSPKLKTIEVTN